jgi:hypothetical protein
MKKIAVMVIASLLSFSPQAAGKAPAKINWKPCAKEIKRYDCKGTDRKIWDCLERHDEELSKACDETVKGDKLFKKGGRRTKTARPALSRKTKAAAPAPEEEPAR